MKRVSLDTETPEVQQFIQKLPLDSDGVELELHGRSICKVIPSLQFSGSEKESLVQERWKLIHRAQERNKGVPSKILEGEVQDAVEEVRRRKTQ